MAKDKLFADAVRVAALMKSKEDPEGRTRVRLIADRLVAEAEAGNIIAMKEVADRMDGKASQQHEADVTIRFEDILAKLKGG